MENFIFCAVLLTCHKPKTKKCKVKRESVVSENKQGLLILGVFNNPKKLVNTTKALPMQR